MGVKSEIYGIDNRLAAMVSNLHSLEEQLPKRAPIAALAFRHHPIPVVGPLKQVILRLADPELYPRVWHMGQGTPHAAGGRSGYITGMLIG